jgi:hypothetical protein
VTKKAGVLSNPALFIKAKLEMTLKGGKLVYGRKEKTELE